MYRGPRVLVRRADRVTVADQPPDGRRVAGDGARQQRTVLRPTAAQGKHELGSRKQAMGRRWGGQGKHELGSRKPGSRAALGRTGKTRTGQPQTGSRAALGRAAETGHDPGK